MLIQEYFGSLPFEHFVAENLHRVPLALPNACPSIIPLGMWATLENLLAAEEADVMVVQRGERYSGPLPKNLSAGQSLCDEGCTILIRNAERHNSQLAAIAETFGESFQAPIDVHLYATPGGSFGFSWHYDAEDVFILQASGEKEYFLRKNTVNPWPVEETLPIDMKYEREIMPLMRVVLRAGDLLYIPCGFWHRAQTIEGSEVAFSIAVGVMSRSAMDIYDLLRSELLQSLTWRQRLPVSLTTTQSDLASAYKHMLSQLATDVAQTLTSATFLQRVVNEFARTSKNRSHQPEQPADSTAGAKLRAE
jgi:50S ribosomal protein L16 3-hydroxylase